ncbi:hypothetical protein, partial [Phocaeicola dorei]
RNTKVSENADMAKTWATKCCPGTYKNNYQLCCGIKDKHNSREQGWLIINIMKATCFKSETTVSNDFPPLFVTVFCGIFYPFISIPVSFGTYRSLSYKLHAKALFCLLLLWY